MANQEHLAILKQGVEAWNNWREEEWRNQEERGLRVSRPDLTGVNLSGWR